MKLTRDVYVVGGGRFGFGISGPLDCHVYVLDGGDGELAGAGVEPDAAVAELAGASLERSQQPTRQTAAAELGEHVHALDLATVLVEPLQPAAAEWALALVGDEEGAVGRRHRLGVGGDRVN